jgi:hypothetical protein
MDVFVPPETVLLFNPRKPKGGVHPAAAPMSRTTHPDEHADRELRQRVDDPKSLIRLGHIRARTRNAADGSGRGAGAL